ncbi:excalibur calcium-binding domain-containing protein [Nocardia cyriacigeorgica]|uniref:Excalibur calcium-binding domain-containing protein n=1 Tax=Nocardia cyriacigeorgica TaxID=135487 RepID=A0A5R8NGD1_9NOCA|nr:excalibur calcium-binding domain-containing protein [Nocardia cyriacigeorgica]TLF73627.1 excalibur calcium-binding domain-containing protein [Nocardia cyriacigeorgica]
MVKSRPVLVILGALLAAVLVLSMTGCGSSKKRRSSSSSHGAAATSTQAYQNCQQVWDAGKAPLRRGSAGYTTQLDQLDGKNDGLACADRPAATSTTKRVIPGAATQPAPTPAPKPDSGGSAHPGTTQTPKHTSSGGSDSRNRSGTGTGRSGSGSRSGSSRR